MEFSFPSEMTFSFLMLLPGIIRKRLQKPVQKTGDFVVFTVTFAAVKLLHYTRTSMHANTVFSFPAPPPTK